MSYALAAFVIGLLILVHEAGHFMAARAAGIPVAVFSIGFGPRLWSFRRGHTEYRLCLIPLGGFVLPDTEDEDDWFLISENRRIGFALGGPAANIALGLLLFSGLCVAEYGLSLNALVLAPLRITAASLWDIFAAFGMLFRQPEHISGVAGIVSMGAATARSGLATLTEFCAFISLNLAVFNLLPVPALDGGKILMCLLEKISPRTRRLQVPLSVTGLILILVLIGYATFLDVTRLAA